LEEKLWGYGHSHKGFVAMRNAYGGYIDIRQWFEFRKEVIRLSYRIFNPLALEMDI